MKHFSRAVIISGDLHNVGDLALLLQCADGLRTRAGVRDILVRQWNAMPSVIHAQLAAAGIGFLPGKHIIRLLAGAGRSLVVVGGGQMARDNSALSSLASVALAMRWARATGGRAAILGCGVDHLKCGMRRRLWRDMLRGAAFAAVRDTSSRQAAVDIAGETHAPVLTADLMFMPLPLHDILKGDGGDPHIVVAPCHDSSEGRSATPSRLAALAIQGCEAASVRRVCIVAHDARADMDEAIVHDTADAVRRLRPDLAVEIVAGFQLDAVLRAYAASRLTITNRLHPVIFSLIAGRPILIVDDGTPKLTMAAARFELESIPHHARAIPADMLRRLTGEMERGPPDVRTHALAEAKRAAALNFDLLAQALGAN